MFQLELEYASKNPAFFLKPKKPTHDSTSPLWKEIWVHFYCIFAGGCRHFLLEEGVVKGGVSLAYYLLHFRYRKLVD